MKKIFILNLIFSILFLSFSCKNKETLSEDTKTDSIVNIQTQTTNKITTTTDTANLTSTKDTSSKTIKKQKKKKTSKKCSVFKKFKIPSPSKFKFASDKTRPVFSALYPTKNYLKASSTYQKSVILGIYSADLIYIALYNNSNLINKYYFTALQLSNDLGIPDSFSANDIKNIQKNMNNNDSIKNIIENTIQNTCISLSNSKTYTELPFIVYGAWLESVYLLCRTLIRNPDAPKFLYKQLSEQSDIIDNLTNFYNNILLDAQNYNVNLKVQDIISQLDSIKQNFGNYYNSGEQIIEKKQIQDLTNQFQNIRKQINTNKQ